MNDRRERFLIVRLTAIGDVVHALPAAAALKRHRPHVPVDWLVDRRAAEILRHSPLIDRLIVFPGGKNMHRRLPQIVTSIVQLRQAAYSAVFDFQGLIKSAVLAGLTRSRQQWGFAAEHLREPVAAALYDHRVSPPAQAAHVIEKGLALVAEFLGHEIASEPWEFPLGVDPQREAELSAALKTAETAAGTGPIVVINPGAAWGTKRWPAERFGELARRLWREWPERAPEKTRPRFVVTWGPGEEALRDAVAQAAGEAQAAVLTFPTRLAHLVPLFRRAALFVGGDTGPMQVAAACATPTVAIFGPTWPDRNGPFSPADRAAVAWHRLPCAGCYARRCPLPTAAPSAPACLDGLSVAAVLAAVRRRLAWA